MLVDWEFLLLLILKEYVFVKKKKKMGIKWKTIRKFEQNIKSYSNNNVSPSQILLSMKRLSAS